MEDYSRVKKLMDKGKYFVVVAIDEPYFANVYRMIREHELNIGRWNEEDEQRYLAAIREWWSNGKINPCPNCDSRNVSVAALGNYVVCHDCGMTGPEGANKEDAVGKWNSLPHWETVFANRILENVRHNRIPRGK